METEQGRTLAASNGMETEIQSSLGKNRAFARLLLSRLRRETFREFHVRRSGCAEIMGESPVKEGWLVHP
jgi:hypothetical protein